MRSLKITSMEIKQAFLFVLFVLLPLGSLFAQEQDFQLRTSVALGTELWGDFEGSVEVQQRFKENASMYDRSLVTLTAGYGFLKGMKTSVGYRMVLLKNNALEFENKYRLTWDLRYKKEVFDVDFRVRTRMQYGYDDNLYNDDFSDKLVSRNLLGASYHIKQTRFTPYVNYELFFHLDNPEYHSFYKTRLVGGCKATITKNSELDLYYMIENEFNVSNPLDAYILGIAWEYNF